MSVYTERPKDAPLWWRDKDACPNKAAHTAGVTIDGGSAPNWDGHFIWSKTGVRCGKTHTQTRCPECELWCIWVPKAQR